MEMTFAFDCSGIRLMQYVLTCKQRIVFITLLGWGLQTWRRLKMFKLIILISCLSFALVMADNCFEYNIEYAGNIINNPLEQRTDSAEDCQKLCKNNSACQGFTWASADYPGT